MLVLTVFIDVILPVFLMAGAGAALARLRGAVPATLSQAVLYVFSPALVFHSLATTEIPPAEVGQIALFALLLMAVLFGVAWSAARLLRLPRQAEAAFLLAVLFMNAGNYGLPVAFLAFGEEGLSRAIVFFVVQAMLGGTVGVFLASRGRAGTRDALQAVARMPLGYAAVAGLAVGVAGLPLPGFLGSATELLGNAAVPGMLLVLGMQLFWNFRLVDVRAVGVATALRLGLSVGLAALLTALLGIGGVTQKVLLIVSGMPSAVFVTVLATEFDARPDLATGAVLVSTGASLVTLTGLVAWLTA